MEVSMPFTLPKLFFAVALAALVFGGMASPNLVWASSIVSMTLLGFAITACRAISTTGKQRRFAAGATIVGLGYLFLASGVLFANISRALITNYPLALLASAMGTATQNYQTTAVYAAPAYYSPPATSAPANAMPAVAPTYYSPGGTPVASPTPSSSAPTADAAADNSNTTSTASSSPALLPVQPTIASTASAGLPVPPPSVSYIQSATQTATQLPLEAIIQSVQLSDPDSSSQPITRLFTIGHCGWSWLLALLAGWFASAVYVKAKRAEQILSTL
jgi:hypothetical protein